MGNFIAATIALTVLFSNTILGQPFIYDNFDGASNWTSTSFGNNNNILAITNSIYSIDNNSLQVTYYDNNTAFYTPGYTIGNSEESAIVYRYFQTADWYNIILKFDWKCNGEKDRDFGSIYYKKSGSDWEKLKTYQSGKGDQIQNESLILPKCSQNSGFYLGFSYTADNSFNFQPGIVIDNMELFGNLCPSNTNPPTPVSQGNFIHCYNNRDSVSLTAASNTGNLRWYSTNGCSEFLYAGPNYKTLPIENKTFFVTSYNAGTGCESNNKLSVSLITLPLPLIYVDTIINATLGGDGSVSISVAGSGPFYYFWSLNNNSTFVSYTQDITGLEEGNYQLFVTDINSCKDSIRAVVLSKAELNIPEGLSPNGDGYNDTWKISGIDQWDDYVVELRNMRGELVYKQDATDNPNYIPFDGNDQFGEKLPRGDYTYLLKSKFRKKKYYGILSIKYE